MFDLANILKVLSTVLHGNQNAAQQQPQPANALPSSVGNINTSRVGFGGPDASGSLISPILQGGMQPQGTDFIRAGAPAMPDGNPQQQPYSTLQDMNYPQTDFLQPANPNRGNDFNSSAPSGMPFDVSHLQSIYANLFGKKS